MLFLLYNTIVSETEMQGTKAITVRWFCCDGEFNRISPQVEPNLPAINPHYPASLTRPPVQSLR